MPGAPSSPALDWAAWAPGLAGERLLPELGAGVTAKQGALGKAECRGAKCSLTSGGLGRFVLVPSFPLLFLSFAFFS